MAPTRAGLRWPLAERIGEGVERLVGRCGREPILRPRRNLRDRNGEDSREKPGWAAAAIHTRRRDLHCPRASTEPSSCPPVLAVCCGTEPGTAGNRAPNHPSDPMAGRVATLHHSAIKDAAAAAILDLVAHSVKWFFFGCMNSRRTMIQERYHPPTVACKTRYLFGVCGTGARGREYTLHPATLLNLVRGMHWALTPSSE